MRVAGLVGGTHAKPDESAAEIVALPLVFLALLGDNPDEVDIVRHNRMFFDN